MKGLKSKDLISQFCAVGVDYKATSLTERGVFSLSNSEKEELFRAANEENIEGFFVLSTCNRTELYSSNSNPNQLRSLFARYSEASEAQIEKYLWQKDGQNAISHLLRVCSGLESNILGDLQIVNQVKKAWKESKTQLSQESKMERWINLGISCSKKVKNETGLSDGCASVSYVAVQSILRWIKAQKIENAGILLIGLGEIGKNCSYNILKHIPEARLVVCNRSKGKAVEFAKANGLEIIDWVDHQDKAKEFDVVVVATGAQNFVISADENYQNRQQLFIDLSVPRNIDPQMADLPTKTLIDLDQLGKQTDATLVERKQAIPKAEELVHKFAQEFVDWLEVRQYAFLMSWLKDELGSLQQEELQRFQRKNPDADLQAATAVSKHMIHSLTAKVARFINANHRDLTQELTHVQAKLQSHS